METLKGTTTIGLTCSDGVVFVSDKRASMGSFIASKRVKKIFNINDVVGASVAGSVGDAESLMRLIKAEASLYEINTNKKMSAEAVATLMANILHGNKIFPYLVQLLIAGCRSGNKDKSKLYSLDPIGGLTEEKMAATGSGSPMAYGVLEQEYEEERGVEENIPVALKALASALERDSGSGNGMELVTITKDGFKEYGEEEVKKIFEQIKKVEMIAAEDIMIKDPICCKPKELAREVHRLMCRYHIVHMPVVDEKNKVLGSISLKDLDNRFDPNPDHKLAYSKGTRIEKLMSEPLVIDGHTNLKDILEKAVENGPECISVVRDDKLVGFITSREIFMGAKLIINKSK